ncbi:MAG: C40 family peptidase [Thermoclostridium sp.]|nr:C40 family peptidase [Thermoclostridium sp.]
MNKTTKKAAFAAALLAMGIASATASLAQPAVPNLDSASDWARVEIVNAYENGLLTDNLQLEYQKSITREEFSELSVKLYEALTDITVPDETENPFWDTENSEVISAYHLGIVNGTGGGEFSPKGTATREEVSVMLYRTLLAAGLNLNTVKKNQTAFSDWQLISDWAQEAVITLRAANVIDGVGDNLFNPKGITSREQAITLVKRIFEKFSEDYVEVTYEDSNVKISRGDERNPFITKLMELIPLEMGKPYQWGGTGPDSYDCSGLVYTLYEKIGISLPRVSVDQAAAGAYVARENLRYGDLVFFARDGKKINHVGIYVGNGEFVHAPQTGDVVKKTTLETGYYDNCYFTARRVIQ